MVVLTLTLPVLVAWYVADKVEAHKPSWFRDPGGVKIPKVEVACLCSVFAALGFLGFVSMVL